MRRFEFPVDLPHAKSVNQTLAEVRSLRLSGIVVALLCAGGAAWLLTLGKPWGYIVGAVLVIAAVTSAWVALWAPRKVGSVQDLYHESPLVPAVVSEVRPRGVTLLALVDIAKPGTTDRRYALVTRNVQEVPGHQKRVGEQVPCAAVLSDRTTRNTTGSWQMVSPMPIAWGTKDAAVLREAAAAIADAEWTLLKSKVKLSEKVGATDDHRLMLDPGDLPGDLR
ncbi:MAG: DUF3239 domain-containing protein [Rhodococcus sp. (in: high G+C Gram-positive bacteria)]|uniref:DUF3239 domain-containing protein n=1 Tax=Rhodococcus sp. TaxID=1831 RepID=UPI003BB62B5A